LGKGAEDTFRTAGVTPRDKHRSAIRFNQHHVTDGTVKARCHYSLDGHSSGRPCVTIYAKDYDGTLGQLLPEAYENNSDAQSDYFDEGRVRLFPDHPLYAAARERAELNTTILEARWAARRNR
jgi:hypothetical protein